MNKTAAVLIVLLLLSSVLILTSEIVNAQNSDVIRIKADGTVTGTDKIKQNGSVYTLTGDLQASVGQNEAFIFIEKSNITLNGAGYTIQGSGSGSGIYMLRSQNVTIENFTICGFSKGIDFWIVENWPSNSSYLNQPSAFNNHILNNKIEAISHINSNQTNEVGWCIYLSDAIQTVISGNSFTCKNPQGGVYFSNSTRNTSLINNNFTGCGVCSSSSNQTVAYGNMVDGKPLIYLDSKSNQVLEEAGLVYLFNCSSIVVKNVKPLYDYAVTVQLVDTITSEISHSCGHVSLINSSNNSIHDNLLNSITLYASSYNKVFTNKIADFSICIKLYGDSSFNTIYDNILLDTAYSSDAERIHDSGFNTAAIQLGDTQLGGAFNNNIYDNTIINHDCAFEFFLSSNNTITVNTIKDCKVGVQLGKSHFNTFTENNITSCNRYAVSMYAESSNNTFYYNNFIDNKVQCIEAHQQTLLSDSETYSVGNTWDNGKTGNYWDTYTGVDINGDGIGDTPYQVFEYMIDNYPLMKPIEISNSHNTIDIPAYDPTPIHPTPGGIMQALSDTKTLTLIIAVCIILGVISGLLIYFRRLIFR
ncbi:MAG: right-handed parallel beta-helix repeat-containing protein [Candidatus Bathyarchaeota archaeon]|nr:right-handed parallel beta-helix repeat-containing protein [Candidatus Termiticorpusculum sp.]